MEMKEREKRSKERERREIRRPTTAASPAMEAATTLVWSDELQSIRVQSTQVNSSQGSIQLGFGHRQLVRQVMFQIRASRVSRFGSVQFSRFGFSLGHVRVLG
ncbi:hypothetical protein HanPI659440_Chr15g0588791 [Helianthus annuus]|nr:hypothetical protein HanPI659440_Chr15g0588791 [Helianthus annuus]